MGASRPISCVVVRVVPVLALLALGGPARAQALGDVGESCRARADCSEGLRCIENVCTQPETGSCEADADCAEGQACTAGRCAAAEEPAAAEEAEEEGEQAGPAATGRWADFELSGTHFFAGVTFAPGITGFWPYGGGLPVWASFFFSLRAGALFGRTELSVELAPVTWVWDFDPQEHPHFTGDEYSGNEETLTFLINIGGLIRLADNVSWPLRFGLGLAALELPVTPVHMQGRLDLIGLVYQHGHLLFELDLPSIRFCSEFRTVGIWAWLFTISITYVV